MSGALSFNVMQFARLLRRAGMAIGTGQVMTALQALQEIDLGRREDLFWTLHAVFVDRHAQTELFRIAFDRFWGGTGGGTATIVDEERLSLPRENAKALPRRIDDAFGQNRGGPQEITETEIGVSWSGAERLRQQDFETMTAAEFAEARRLIAQLRLPIPDVLTRRFKPAARGSRIDMRGTLRAMVRAGGAFDLKYAQRRRRHPPLVVLCDISGSMAAYARMLLHFLHAVTNDRDRVSIFLFGTRLTNVTREMTQRDPDEALARVSRAVQDWSGGTRIGQVLAGFNRLWSRRALGQGATVLLITDGLDRDGGIGLAREMERLQRSCRALIWLNPLLRFDAFEPKSAGIRAMLPFVDEFRSVHNLDSLASLVDALSTAPNRIPRAA